ncbi:hypothetical protein AVEN_181034-1 [Araneus ventricosus]|uniref:Uncharacterized protein n=1 Tax=Araneus ventricosus TaxID=182803 RepID=A0A4Y2L206_ARAVE|nr:hypothetical protein AVEN_181034-1 [Araneus ventricosus]
MSELIRDFKSELITQLRCLKPRSRLPKSVLYRSPRSNFKIPLLSLPQGVELRLPFTPLDNYTQGRPTTKLPCSQWPIPTVGWYLSFLTTGAIQE